MKLYHADSSDKIDIFGFNIFYSDADEISDTLEPQESEPDDKKLILIAKKGDVVEKPYPITGEIVLFAVRNKETNDAKIYQVSIDTGGDSSTVPGAITFNGNTQASFVLPDSQVVTINQLAGQLQGQAVNELERSVQRLQEQSASSAPDAVLDEAERKAVERSLASSS